MIHCCGTCGRWNVGRKVGREFFLGGKCPLDYHERHAKEMLGCLGWKKPTQDQLDQRVRAELIKAEEVASNV